jgi:endonuclease/exonuclease/phosphatase family metal-dependent hydrolase
MTKVASRNCQQCPDRAIVFLEKTAADCDVICVQEAGTRENIWNDYKKKNENIYIDGNCFVNDPCLVVTKLKVRPAKTEVLDTEAGKNKNRSTLLTTLKDQTLIVVNVHLTSGNPRAASSELLFLVEHLERTKTHWLIVGDFNCDPRQYTNFKKFTIQDGPKHASGRILDYAMSDLQMKLTAYPNYCGSDHGGFYVAF